jgi:hypothetical protein
MTVGILARVIADVSIFLELTRQHRGRDSIYEGITTFMGLEVAWV